MDKTGVADYRSNDRHRYGTGGRIWPGIVDLSYVTEWSPSPAATVGEPQRELLELEQEMPIARGIFFPRLVYVVEKELHLHPIAF